MADALSRPDQITEGARTVLSSWRYIGLSMIAGQKYDAAAAGGISTELTYGPSSGGYAGYDAFGRIVETLWKIGATEQVHSKYGRDGMGQVMWRQDVKAVASGVATEDNFYWYDGLQQVTQHQRGTLTPAPPNSTGITSAQQTEV